ncbi:membrane protein YczE [Nocardioides terrisoli]|uniref:membrane protein YczE n=1 Tax=Nocardioides terrisoli TaxID=3388267 RepID=UPI00287B929E|nr:hypothetical protein [Nocardioides marmorisolisilvae]
MSTSSLPAPRQLARLSPLGQLRAGRLLRRLVQLYVGLVAYGLTLALLIRAHLGNAPWDVLHQGLADHLPISIGQAVIAVSFLVLLLWIPLREVPGLGTLSNAVVIGLAADLGLSLMHEPRAIQLRILMTLAGVIGNAVATACYIGAQLGPGPRDGLMTGLNRRTGVPIGPVRTGIEVTVVVVGFFLGGVLGFGTLIYAVAIGPLVQRLLPLFVVPLAAGGDQG